MIDTIEWSPSQQPSVGIRKHIIVKSVLSWSYNERLMECEKNKNKQRILYKSAFPSLNQHHFSTKSVDFNLPTRHFENHLSHSCRGESLGPLPHRWRPLTCC